MPNRVLKETINESRGLSDCSFFAQDLYKRLITYADDYGRFNADPQIMLARLYPRDLDVVLIEDLIDGLTDLAGVNKIAFYMGKSIHEDKVYGCFPNWAEHQRIRDSKKKCPDPDDTRVNDWYLRRFIPMSMKIALLQRDQFTCAECGKRISETDNAKALVKMGSGLFHIDHIVPVNQGGRATMENLRILCPKCNLSRPRRLSFDDVLQFAETCGEFPQVSANICDMRPNPIQSNPNPHPNPHPNPDAREDDDAGQFISTDEAHRIHEEQDCVLDAAEDAGFKCSTSERANLIKLYAAHGLQKVLAGIESCVKHGAPNLAYLEACMKDEPKKPRASPGKIINAQAYAQRDYSSEQEEAMQRMLALAQN